MIDNKYGVRDFSDMKFTDTPGVLSKYKPIVPDFTRQDDEATVVRNAAKMWGYSMI